jgi:hypothetical protein
MTALAGWVAPAAPFIASVSEAIHRAAEARGRLSVPDAAGQTLIADGVGTLV